ncbi:MAG: pyridoxal phosphate-dependent aminotransferase [Oscillospiraceae bacterium]|nr:pyridoxal phosphate-dependent aminotransferase [Oscillospiraceae bacterium]MBP1574090.1 pyridoxal phosphate-dependent aminotransferase [Oscillospiraceae bacterium]
MKYDFETLVNRRNTGSHKWEGMYEQIPNAGDDIVPLSVADMELKNPPAIIEGLKKYLDNIILGYTGETENYYKSVTSWMERRHGFSPKKEWFVMTAGVVPAIKEMVGAFTKDGDSVLMLTPVYYPFYSSVEANGRTVLGSELILEETEYRIDFDDFAEKAARPETTLCILSSPHNPIGRIWTKEELLKLCEICLENNVFIISDEIHFDLIMPGFEHVSMGTFEEKYLNNCAICTAPSKTFNLAGLQTSNIFIPNEEYRNKMTAARGYFSLNIFGYKACELAYDECEEWLDELLLFLDENRKFVEEFVAEKMPEVKVHRLQGTYLMWLDFRAWGMNEKELEDFMVHKAEAIFDEGYVFGEGGIGFERINIACPKRVLEATLERIYKAKKEL